MLKQRASLIQKHPLSRKFFSRFFTAQTIRSAAATVAKPSAPGLRQLTHTGIALSLYSIALLTNSQAIQANETEARNIAEEMTTLVTASNTVEAPQPRVPTGQDTHSKSLPESSQESDNSKSDDESTENTLTTESAQPVASAEEDNIPKAKSVDLAQPISNDELNAIEEAEETPQKHATEPQETITDGSESDNSKDDDISQPPVPSAKSIKLPDATPEPSQEQGQELPPAKTLAEQDKPETPAIVEADSLLILGTKVPPSTSTRLAWSPSQSFEGLSLPTPVLVVNGAHNGPTLCLTAAVHGDELNGIEIVRRVLYGLDPEELNGAVIGVPIVNLQGFRRNSRYLADRRDLNRYFPGNQTGSSASRIAYSFFNSVISHCDALVDLHTGSFDRINLPQLRADLRNKEIAKLTHNFGATVVLHSTGAEGTLRRAAAESGIPAVTLEAGGPIRLEEDSVSHGVAGIQTLLNSMGMIKKFSFWGKPEPVYYQSSWIRVNHGGILFSNVKLGNKIKAGDVLGTVTDPITNVRHEIVSSHEGRLIGMALNQVMLPGFAAYHIGIAAKDETKVVPPEESPQINDTDLSKADKENLDETKATSKTLLDADKDVQENADANDARKSGSNVESEE